MPQRLLLFLAGLGLLSISQAAPAAAQRLDNDGFHRRNGQMHVLRNGQLRPMTRDARLPTGATITKDGFIVAPNGQRTELREGQACDLRGRVVAVVPSAGGSLALGSSASRRNAAEVRTVLADVLGGRYYEGDEDDEDRSEHARELRKEGEEWRRDEEKRREEHQKERGKKWKKWKKGKHWDD